MATELSAQTPDHPELLIISSLHKKLLQKKFRTIPNSTLPESTKTEEQQPQLERYQKNANIINLNTLDDHEGRTRKKLFTEKKNSFVHASNEKNGKLVFSQENRNRYHEMFKTVSKKGKGVRVLSKYNFTINDEKNIMHKFMRIQKMETPPAPPKTITHNDISTLFFNKDRGLYNSTGEKKKNLFHRKKHKRNFSSVLSDDPRAIILGDKSKIKLQESDILGPFTKRQNHSKKKCTIDIPIRKPMVRKDYFVFGMGDRVNAQNKVENYRDFLWKVNYSNSIYVITPEVLVNPYKAYIGPGNNSFLIKGILKRRYWWVILDKSEIAEANFIWTQLKVNSFFKKQPKGKLAIDYQPNKQFDRIWQSAEQCEKKIFGKIDLYLWKNYLSKNQKFEEKITENTYAKRFCLYSKKQMQRIDYSERLRLHNHLESNFYIGNKKALFYNISNYLAANDIDPFCVIPLTFHIVKGIEDPEYQSFLEYYEKFQEKKKNDKSLRNVWIVKPGQNSNRGTGITVCQTLDDIIVRLKGRERNSDGKLRTFILQKYIEKPLLYYRRKFDIRHYMLVSCVNGQFKAYWYEEGYIRTSSLQFSSKNWKDPYIHLTNDAIQKSSGTYGRFEKGNKLSYSEFQKYLDGLGKSKGHTFVGDILPKMKQIGLYSIKACYSMLDANRLQNNFQLLGLDFMIDEQFMPWLIQVNTNPCLQMSCSLMEKIIPQMIENVFRICVDPLFPPPECWQPGKKCFFGDNPLQDNKFEVIFDEISDSPKNETFQSSRQLIARKMGKIEQDNQIFQDDGDEQWQK